MTEVANVPRSVGIIMDGNRRWARREGLPLVAGHRRGADTLGAIAEAARDAGVGALTLYTFSTENWGRSEEEVSYLMDLMREYLRDQGQKLIDEGARIVVVGQKERLAPDIQAQVEQLEERSKDNPLTLALALSYGGRADLVQAINTMIKEGNEITEEDVKAYLTTRDVPDPDLIIRTGGAQRLSGFLTWESVYSELMFTDTFWPEFSKEEFLGMLTEYGQRERRHGK
ncbi:di-trans,poly-cis-decaprenylcistransferase [Patescibacteria group bacterium]|jgi:undecaprenyl diphosphate synthase|nr:di-trans,poly-cis-decaprenylcistransferase [Patescibacteria group bacterium]